MLSRYANDILLPFYDDLYDFFKDIFDKRKKYHYIVLATQRCANLADIFLSIVSDSKVPHIPPNVISASALLSTVPTMAKSYKMWGRFPSLLVIEDIHIYGESLNTFLKELEGQLCAQLQPEGATKEQICNSLTQAIQIKAFTRNNKPSLLSSQYQCKFMVAEMMEPKQWHDLCNRISYLSLVCGMVNPSFVVGSRIKKGFENWTALHKSGFSQVDTTYNNFSQKLFCRIVTLKGSQPIIYTIRVFPYAMANGWIAVPFVFLPDLTEQQVDVLTKTICSQIGCTSFTGGLWQNCPQIKAEALTMLLSVSLLKEVCATIGVVVEYADTPKLQMNFGAGLNGDVKNLTDYVLTHSEVLMTLPQMDKAIADALSTSALNRNAGSGRQLDNGGDALKELLEDLVYEFSIKYYSQDYWNTQMHQEENVQIPTETSDHYILFSAVVEKLCNACQGQYSYHQILSWILQMVDAGILAIAIRTFETGQSRYIAQCVKPT